MISQDDLDHRLLPEIIHGGYDGPLFDECWKGHGLLGVQFRWSLTQTIFCFFPLISAEARCLAKRCSQVCYSIILTYAFLSGWFMQHYCPLASQTPRPLQQAGEFFQKKKTYHCHRGMNWIYSPPRIPVANEGFIGIPLLKMSFHPGGDEPASWMGGGF